jgi:AcrR family transcriptional regulator
MGLRERKKLQTRQLIAETAWRLFADRGFEQVTVAEVARQAQVAVATVFNYFPTKEDLFYYPLDAFGARLIDTVSDRTEGEPVLVACRRYILESSGLLADVEAGDPQALERLRTLNRVIAASPALLAREQRALTGTADALAALLAAETDAPAHDLRSQAAANAIIGVQRALIDYTRRRILADERPTQIAADVSRLGHHAFALLEHGLGDYATKPPRPIQAPTAIGGTTDTDGSTEA